jgi:pimeloyl-ACP methyl ester carboxylesterase
MALHAVQLGAPARVRGQRCAARPARAAQPGLRRVLASASADEAGERFVWKGGGDARGRAWEQAALRGRGGYATDSLEWFFLDAGPPSAAPLVLLHGMASYSYLWRGVVPRLSAQRRVLCLDLPGFGNSLKPQAGAAFDYSLASYCSALESVLFSTLKLPRDGSLDVAGQGILGGTLAALLATRCPVRRVALLNAPLTPEAATTMPKPLQFLTNPFTGPISAQNPLAITPIQSGGPFVIEPDDTAAYIAPALADSGAGWAAIAIAKELRKSGAAASSEALRGLEARGAEVLLLHGVPGVG